MSKSNPLRLWLTGEPPDASPMAYDDGRYFNRWMPMLDDLHLTNREAHTTRDIASDAALWEFVTEISESRTTSELFGHLTSGLREMVDATWVSVCLVDPDNPRRIVVSHADGLNDALPLQAVLFFPNTLIGTTIQSKELLQVKALDRTESDVQWMAAAGVTEIIIAPLVVNGRSIGSLNATFMDAQPGAGPIFEHSARLTALHLERMETHESLGREVELREKYNERLQELHAVERELSLAMCLDDVIEVLSRSLVGLVDAARVSYGERGPGPDEVTLHGVLGMDPIPAGTVLHLDEGWFDRTFAESTYDYNPDHTVTTNVRHKVLAELGMLSSIGLAICVAGRPVGALNVAATKRDHFSTEDRAILVALASFMGITLERIAAQDQLSYEASHDHLTGLVRRDLFEEELQCELERLSSTGMKSSLCFLDVDAFKLVNDQFGHLVGDALLRDIAARLKRELGSTDLPARVGGDEFLILLRDVDLEGQSAIAEKLVRSISDTPFFVDDQTVESTISLGLCHLDDTVASVHEAVARADAACYASKRQGGNSVSLASDTDHEQRHRRASAGQIAMVRSALANGTMRLAAQPILNVQSGKIDAVELLLRLSQDGIEQPANAIIAAVERYGLNSELDEWVVGEAGRLWPTLAEEFGSSVHVFINLSANSLCSPTFGDVLAAQVQASAIPASQICFEITETGTMRNFEAALEFLEHIKQFGPRFAIDDFGVGLSSLGHLRRLPVDILKIDGTLVSDVAQDPVLATMVSSIAAMSRALGMLTVAEHVETPAAMHTLQEIGIDYAQGYLIGRPRHLDG